jgi:hypothetical protein
VVLAGRVDCMVLWPWGACGCRVHVAVGCMCPWGVCVCKVHEDPDRAMTRAEWEAIAEDSAKKAADARELLRLKKNEEDALRAYSELRLLRHSRQRHN